MHSDQISTPYICNILLWASYALDRIISEPTYKDLSRRTEPNSLRYRGSRYSTKFLNHTGVGCLSRICTYSLIPVVLAAPGSRNEGLFLHFPGHNTLGNSNLITFIKHVKLNPFPQDVRSQDLVLGLRHMPWICNSTYLFWVSLTARPQLSNCVPHDLRPDIEESKHLQGATSLSLVMEVLLIYQ